MEAKSSTELSSGPSSDPRQDRVLDFLRGLDLSGFLLGVDELITGSKDLRQRFLAGHIRESLKRTLADNSGRVLIPPFENEDGWKIRLRAVSNSSYRSENGSVPYRAWSRTWSGPSYALLNALEEKGRRYGNQLTVPFVIALNSFDPMLTRRDYEGPLFGERGFWGTASAPRCRRVSAVLFTKNLWPETLLVGQVESRLYLNPFADWPYKGVLTKLDTFRFEDGSWQCSPGAPIHRLLQLRLHDSSLWEE